MSKAKKPKSSGPDGPLKRAIRRLVSRVREYEARAAQRRYVGKYVAITGSCGKTTATLLIGAILKNAGSVSVASHENAGSIPLRHIRKLRERVDYVVQEVSAHQPGSLDSVVNAFDIGVAVVTSVGEDHGARYRGIGDIPTAIAREKGRLVEAVKPDGLVCLNADDPLVRAMAERTGARVVLHGRSEDAELRAIHVEARWPGRLQFDLVIGERSYHVATRFVGTIMLPSVLSALAVAHGLGLDMDQAVATLATVGATDRHMNVVEAADGNTYIVDTYKAPLWSTRLVAADLVNLAHPNLVFVLGDMSDIISDNSRKYRQVMRAVAPHARVVIATATASRYARPLIDGGCTNVVIAPTNADVAAVLRDYSSCLVMLKSSEKVELQQVLELVGQNQHHAAEAY